jgi:hypothetical protein
MKVFRAFLGWLFASRKAGLFVGRRKTHDAASRKKPFVCDVDATWLKKNPNVTKNARSLYGTMKALANGKTGKLCIRGNPLNWEFIRRQAEVCKNVWQRSLKELIDIGLVSIERERVTIYRDGRKRSVLGRATYLIHRQPKTVRKRRILQEPFSSTVQKKGAQDFQRHPEAGAPGLSGSGSDRKKEYREQSSSPTANADDDSRVNVSDSAAKPNPFLSSEDETLGREVQARIRAQYPETYDRHKANVDDLQFVVEAIAMIDGRGQSAISVPDAYFAAGLVKILDCDVDVLAVSDILARKKLLRGKYMARFEPNLTPEREEAMRRFREMVATKEGKPS